MILFLHPGRFFSAPISLSLSGMSGRIRLAVSGFQAAEEDPPASFDPLGKSFSYRFVGLQDFAVYLIKYEANPHNLLQANLTPCSLSV